MADLRKQATKRRQDLNAAFEAHRQAHTELRADDDIMKASIGLAQLEYLLNKWETTPSPTPDELAQWVEKSTGLGSF